MQEILLRYQHGLYLHTHKIFSINNNSMVLLAAAAHVFFHVPFSVLQTKSRDSIIVHANRTYNIAHLHSMTEQIHADLLVLCKHMYKQASTEPCIEHTPHLQQSLL